MPDLAGDRPQRQRRRADLGQLPAGGVGDLGGQLGADAFSGGGHAVTMVPYREQRSQERAPLLTACRAGGSIAPEREHRSRHRIEEFAMALHVIVGKGPGRHRPPPGALARPGARGAGAVAQRRHAPPTGSSTARSTPPTRPPSPRPRAGPRALYNAVNPAYHRWATDWPPVAAALLTAAERSGAVLVTMSQPVRLRPADRADDAETPAGRHRRQGPGAGADVGRRPRRARGRPGAGHRGAGVGLRRAPGPARPVAPDAPDAGPAQGAAAPG